MPNWQSQDPGAWGWPRGSAANIVPFAYRGYRFPQGVAAGTTAIWTAALDALTSQPGFSLPPNPDPNVAGTWGFEDRAKSGGGGWSFHAYGLALDIAAPWNPRSANVPPASPHRLPTNTAQLVEPLGIQWGGSWSGVADWMHLEIHLSPAEVAQHAVASMRVAVERPRFPLPAGYYYGPYSGPRESISGIPAPGSDPAWQAGLRMAQAALGVVADGVYGPITAAATRRFQQSRGLQVDGLIGPKTWAALVGG